MRTPDFIYSGSELEGLEGARNYYRWLLRRFSPFVGAHVVEVGAGTGTFSEFLLTLPQVQRLVAIEPSENNFPILSRRLARDPRASAVKGYLRHAPASSADTLVAVNVLEHVEHDDEFLRQAWETARPNGTMLLFVPAVPAIFGSLDTAFEHFRRYTRSSLRQRVETARWHIEKIGYMNLPGILTWFVAGKVLRRTSIGGKEARLYDRLVVPVAAAIEDRVTVPIGQSLVAIGRKKVA